MCRWWRDQRSEQSHNRCAHRWAVECRAPIHHIVTFPAVLPVVQLLSVNAARSVPCHANLPELQLLTTGTSTRWEATQGRVYDGCRVILSSQGCHHP